ncbi:hypothetical protein [Segetibacter sp.]|jgi:hypothetical protein|uniref:hypothetical protein n=1 Tax=Segetibacter sp. TaxID=2231182 RepID=UPI00261E2B2F|nr:hypothetical protein [Segetibacter sp.]MCW3081803.1 hypothetical protein [Segetibacter sp.]
MQEFKKTIVSALLLFHFSAASTQSTRLIKDKAISIYFAFGTNLSFYSKSDITFKSSASPAYNFTIRNVRAKDDQGLKFNSGGAPQYSYQVGYYNNRKNWGIEFNFDHIKYIMQQFQRVRLNGTIDGEQYNLDTLITPGFIRFEHTDGANYALLKWVKRIQLIPPENQKKALSLVLKAGAGPVIPKTNSTIMGKHKDDSYKISGYVAALEGGLLYNFARSLLVEASAKGAYADYRRFLIANGTGSQRWFGLHLNLLFGLQLPGR